MTAEPITKLCSSNEWVPQHERKKRSKSHSHFTASFGLLRILYIFFIYELYVYIHIFVHLNSYIDENDESRTRTTGDHTFVYHIHLIILQWNLSFSFSHYLMNADNGSTFHTTTFSFNISKKFYVRVTHLRFYWWTLWWFHDPRMRAFMSVIQPIDINFRIAFEKYELCLFPSDQTNEYLMQRCTLSFFSPFFAKYFIYHLKSKLTGSRLRVHFISISHRLNSIWIPFYCNWNWNVFIPRDSFSIYSLKDFYWIFERMKVSYETDVCIQNDAIWFQIIHFNKSSVLNFNIRCFQNSQ